MEEAASHSCSSHSSLLCAESTACFDQEIDDVRRTLVDFKYNCKSTGADDDDQYIEMLFEREISSFEIPRHHLPPPPCPLTRESIQRVRRDAVRWILNTTGVFGFGFQTAYLSITYLDRFLSKRTIHAEKAWAIRLLSVACLSLASKMEESVAPSLSELIRVDGYGFESKVIRRMELLVLNTLEWRMGSITPFAFIHYLIPRLCREPPPPLNAVSTTLQLILTMMREKSSTDQRPSIIAAAAVLVALEQDLTRSEVERRINSIASSRFLETEDVFLCYNLLHQLETEKLKIPKLVISPDLSPIILDVSSVPSAVGTTKRKRLSFRD